MESLNSQESLNVQDRRGGQEQKGQSETLDGKHEAQQADKGLMLSPVEEKTLLL